MEHPLTLIIYFNFPETILSSTIFRNVFFIQIKFYNILNIFDEIRWKYFEISIFLVLHFLLVRTSFNHISANFEIKEKNFVWMSLLFATVQEKTF